MSQNTAIQPPTVKGPRDQKKDYRGELVDALREIEKLKAENAELRKKIEDKDEWILSHL